jgi:hypothetical protein
VGLAPDGVPTRTVHDLRKAILRFIEMTPPVMVRKGIQVVCDGVESKAREAVERGALQVEKFVDVRAGPLGRLS